MVNLIKVRNILLIVGAVLAALALFVLLGGVDLILFAGDNSHYVLEGDNYRQKASAYSEDFNLSLSVADYKLSENATTEDFSSFSQELGRIHDSDIRFSFVRLDNQYVTVGIYFISRYHFLKSTFVDSGSIKPENIVVSNADGKSVNFIISAVSPNSIFIRVAQSDISPDKKLKVTFHEMPLITYKK